MAVFVCKQCDLKYRSNFELDICPSCADNNLFDKVREYIRNNDVNEIQVAEHFDIPLSRVKGWVKEGRITYKKNAEGKYISLLRCEICGDPIDFGKVCFKCSHRNMIKGSYSGMNIEENRMRFLND